MNITPANNLNESTLALLEIKEKSMKSILYLLVTSLFLTACGSTTPLTEISPTANPTAETISVADYKNATYQIESQSVTLVDGLSDMELLPGSASRMVTRYFGNEAMGDLNSDARDDIAFLLTQTTGGSGTFYYVVAALQTASGVEGTNAIFLGDRIAPQTTSITNGTITVNYADRNPGESFTVQPSLGVSRLFKIENDILIEILR